jgi:hypothetical protein
LGDAYASNLVKEGYKIPQVGAPDVSYREANNRSALNKTPWVRGEVARLLEAGCIVQVPQQPRCTNPLTVAYNQKLDGTIKKRLCIDLLRHVNVYVPPDAYKMVTLKEVFEMTMPGTYMSTFDLEKAYHNPSSYQLVGFLIPGKGGEDETYYVYVILVFNLRTAAQVLGLLLKPLNSFLAEEGVALLVYVDDGLTTAASKAKADANYERACALYGEAGLLISVKKSDPPGSSTTRKIYLGFEIDTVDMTVTVPAAKFARVKNFLQDFLLSPHHTASEASSVIGRLVAMEPALRAFWHEAHTHQGCGSLRRVLLGPRVCGEQQRHGSVGLRARPHGLLEQSPLRALHTGFTLASVLHDERTFSLDVKIPARPLAPVPALVASDASNSLVAAYSVCRLPDFTHVKTLSAVEATWSSSRRELCAVQHALEHLAAVYGRFPVHTTLFWLSDNQNVAKFLSKGSGKTAIMLQSLGILATARSLNLDVFAVWVRRNNPQLVKADALSKHVDTDNWSVTPEGFAEIRALTDMPFTANLFGTAANAKINKFYCLTFETGCAGVDAFAHDWSGEQGYVAPPVLLICRVMRKISVSPACKGILIVPLWHSARFWTAAFKDGRHLNGLFALMRCVRLETLAWDTSLTAHVAIGGKSLQFLALGFNSSMRTSHFESISSPERCIRCLFTGQCSMCNKLSTREPVPDQLTKD